MKHRTEIIGSNGHLNGNGKPRKRGGKGEGTPTPPPEKPLDMTEANDRKLLQSAVVKGWPITSADMKFYYDRLKEATNTAKNARELTSCVKVFTTIVGQVQVQEHHDIKNSRIDNDQGTDLIVTYSKGTEKSRFDADYA